LPLFLLSLVVRIIEKYGIVLIDGNEAKEEKVVAYCNSRLHEGYLSKKMVSSHKCLHKKCKYLRKIDYDYFRTINDKMKRSMRKFTLSRDAQVMLEYRDAFIKRILERKKGVYVTKISKHSNNGLIVSYIYENDTDLQSKAKTLMKALDIEIVLKRKSATTEALAYFREKKNLVSKRTKLTAIPGIGEATKQHLNRLGFFWAEDMYAVKGELLYNFECLLNGVRIHGHYLKAYCKIENYLKDN